MATTPEKGPGSSASALSDTGIGPAIIPDQITIDFDSPGDAANPNDETRFEGDVYEVAPAEPEPERIVFVPPPEHLRRESPTPKPDPRIDRSGQSSGGTTGIGYQRNEKRREKMRRSGGTVSSQAQAEAQTARFRKIAALVILSLVTSIGSLIAWNLAPVVQRMNTPSYPPLDGILAQLKGKPLLATLDSKGQLCFKKLADYDSKVEDGVLTATYTITGDVDPGEALAVFADKMPHIENQFMNRALTKTSSAAEIKQKQIFNRLREAVQKWLREQEKNAPIPDDTKEQKDGGIGWAPSCPFPPQHLLAVRRNRGERAV